MRSSSWGNGTRCASRPARGEATRPGRRASRSSSSARPISARLHAKTSRASATGGLTSRAVRKFCLVHPDPPDLPPEPEQPDLSAVRIVEARLNGVSLAEERRLGLSLQDCALHDCDLANLDAHGGALRRVEFRVGRLTGCNLSEATLCDVNFEECRADMLAFAGS